MFVTYNGLLDPLGPTQIVPYIERLARRWPIHIVSFERSERLGLAGLVARMRERLADQGIGWSWLKYHKYPSLPATTFDLVQGVLELRRLADLHPIGLIHCRGYLPMAIAASAGLPDARLLFDIRGLQPEEYVDGNLWKKGEMKWRLAKLAERTFFARADAAVVLSENIRPYIQQRLAEHGREVPLEVIPCCADLERVNFDAETREQIRSELAIDPDATVFVYCGSVGTWYMPEEMARFVRVFRDQTGQKSVLLWLVNEGTDVAAEAGRKAGLTSEEQRIISTRSERVAGYLSAADVALALIRPCFSKRASSPTKYGECLAVGLPLVISGDVGDGQWLEDRDAAVCLHRFSEADMAAAIPSLLALTARPREHFRRCAGELFDLDGVALPRYARLYEELLTP